MKIHKRTQCRDSASFSLIVITFCFHESYVSFVLKAHLLMFTFLLLHFFCSRKKNSLSLSLSFSFSIHHNKISGTRHKLTQQTTKSTKKLITKASLTQTTFPISIRSSFKFLQVFSPYVVYFHLSY